MITILEYLKSAFMFCEFQVYSFVFQHLCLLLYDCDFFILSFRSLGHVHSHSSLVGYCPQEDALDDLVSVEEHLYFYARIHGIPEKDIKEVGTSLRNPSEI